MFDNHNLNNTESNASAISQIKTGLTASEFCEKQPAGITQPEKWIAILIHIRTLVFRYFQCRQTFFPGLNSLRTKPDYNYQD